MTDATNQASPCASTLGAPANQERTGEAMTTTGRAVSRIKASLGWGSAVLVATLGLIGAMGLTPAAAQSDPITGTNIVRGGDDVASRTLILPEGKAAIIDLPRAAADVLISDPEKVEAIIRTPRRVYVLGREAGITSAFFFDRSDNQILNLEIRVEKDGNVIADMIERLLPTARITVETLGESIVLHGTADTPADAQRALEIAERFAGPGLAAGGGGGGGGGGAGGAGGGGAGSAIQGSVMNLISVRQPGQVMLKVRILEMQRRLTRQLGIDLNGVVNLDDNLINIATANAVGVGTLTGNVSSTDIGGSGINAALNTFEQNGLVRTLAEPSLIALSGQEAEFFAGGEVGFPVLQQDGAGNIIRTAQFEPFGVELKFQPTVRSKGSINVVLATSVSDVDQSLGVDGIPGFLRRATTTTVDLPSGASFAIAGLLQENIQEAVEGLPVLKEAPVLGQLFRSQNFDRRETELVIIATPYLVEPSTLAELTEPGENFVPPSALQSALLGQLEAANGVRGRGVDEARLSGPIGFILD